MNINIIVSGAKNRLHSSMVIRSKKVSPLKNFIEKMAAHWQAIDDTIIITY